LPLRAAERSPQNRPDRPHSAAPARSEPLTTSPVLGISERLQPLNAEPSSPTFRRASPTRPGTATPTPVVAPPPSQAPLNIPSLNPDLRFDRSPLPVNPSPPAFTDQGPGRRSAAPFARRNQSEEYKGLNRTGGLDQSSPPVNNRMGGDPNGKNSAANNPPVEHPPANTRKPGTSPVDNPPGIRPPGNNPPGNNPTGISPSGNSPSVTKSNSRHPSRGSRRATDEFHNIPAVDTQVARGPIAGGQPLNPAEFEQGQVSAPPDVPLSSNVQQASLQPTSRSSVSVLFSPANSAGGFPVNPRSLGQQPRFFIPPRPAPHVASFHKLNAVQLHQRLNGLWTGSLAQPGAAPHTPQWLQSYNVSPWWGSTNPPDWAWGAAGLAGLDNWLGSDWSADAKPFIYYTGGKPLMLFDDAVSIPEEAIKIGNRELRPGDDWIPLGVFGLMPPDASEYAATIQLAVNRQGVVRGYAVETATGVLHKAIGGFDRSKLRIAWTFPGAGAYKFEASVANLLQSESLVNVYDPVDCLVSAWQIVRDPPVDRS
jgi:hypothetical protein